MTILADKICFVNEMLLKAYYRFFSFHFPLVKDVSFFARKCTHAQLPASAILLQEGNKLN